MAIIGFQILTLIVIIGMVIHYLHRLDEIIIPISSDKLEYLQFKLSLSKNIGKRNSQEDSILLIDKYSQKIDLDLIAVLCDGMGGIEKGELASSLTVREVGQELSKIDINTFIPDKIQKVIQDMSLKLYDLSVTYEMPERIGTTLALTIVNKGQLYWGTVGDSRIYLYRNNELIWINQDTNYLNELFEKVIHNEEDRIDVLEHEKREQLTGYIGKKNIGIIDQNIKPFKLRHSDIIIICSDGIYNTISRSDIIHILENYPIEMVSNEIINKVLSYDLPNQDNMSLIAFEYLSYFDEGAYNECKVGNEVS